MKVCNVIQTSNEGLDLDEIERDLDEIERDQDDIDIIEKPITKI